jgi:sigma-B regulation protein RsbU (phosphoserine phosphatase)
LKRDSLEVHPLKDYDPRHGPALGLFEKTDYPTCRCPFAPGDFVFLFTDGVYEVTDAQGEEFGQVRLLQAVRKRIQIPAEELFVELLAEVQRFSGSQEFEDDVCLVGVEAARPPSAT